MDGLIRKTGIALILVCSLLLSGCSNREGIICLEQLKNKEEYSFNAIPWNASFDEVVLLLSDELEVDTAREPFPQGCTLYRSNRMYNLDGKTCSPTFEFQNEGLKMIQFEFLVETQECDWIEKEREKIVTLYGAESEELERENSDLQLKTSASKWETEHSMLQFIALSNGSGETRVIIALVKK